MNKLTLQTTLKNIGLLASAGLLFGACAQKRDALSGQSVEQGLVITGSKQVSQVAWAPLNKMINFFFPQATALLPSNMTDSNGVSVELNDAWIVVEEVQLEYMHEDIDDLEESDEDEVEFSGPYFVNLLLDNPAPVDTALIPKIPYNRIEMKLGEAEFLPEDAPNELLGQGIYLSGSVGGRSFSFSDDRDTEFEASNELGVSPDSLSNMIVAIRLGEILQNIDLSTLVHGTHISHENRIPLENACPNIQESADDLYTCLRKGLESKAKFGKDQDGDDDLDDEEEDESHEDENENEDEDNDDDNNDEESDD